MKRVKVKEMGFQNYKCFSDKSFSFANKTEVSGRNRVGKTTLMDGYFDILTGKLANGSEPNDIRPHDNNGEVLRKVDVVRSATLDIDGWEHTLKKVDFEKWVRPRGSVEEVFKGNGTTYEVDDIPMKTKTEYVAWLSDNIAPMDDILLCSNPQFFLGKLAKSSVEARKLLEKISGFDAETNNNPEFAEALAIMNGHNAEDTLKRLRSNLSKAKENQEKKNTEIAYEAGKTFQTDFSADELLLQKMEQVKAEHEAELALLEGDNDKSAEIRAEYNKLRNTLFEYDNKMKAAAAERVSLAQSEFRTAETEFLTASNAEARFNDKIRSLKAETDRIKTDIIELGVKWQQQNELAFAEGDAICPYCGQRLPEDKIMEMQNAFNAKKASALKNIENEGNKLREKHTDTLKDIAELETELQTVVERKKQLGEKLNVAKAELEKARTENTYNPDADEYRKEIVSNLAVADEHLKNLECADAKKTAEIREKIASALEGVALAKAKIASKKSVLEEHKQTLENLNNELLTICDGAAKIERDIQCIMDYSIKKNQIIEEMVNKHFHHFQFKFLEFTQEGNPVEVCQLMVDGTAYNGLLNGGDKRLAEVDLCRGFQEMKGLSLPIWLDEAGTVDKWRLPETEQQLICIRYAEHEGIEVKEIG